MIIDYKVLLDELSDKILGLIHTGEDDEKLAFMIDKLYEWLENDPNENRLLAEY